MTLSTAGKREDVSALGAKATPPMVKETTDSEPVLTSEPTFNDAKDPAALLAEKEFPVTVMVPEVKELVTTSVLVITEVLANNLLTYKLAKRLLKEPNEMTLSKFGNNEDVKALGANATPPMVNDAKDPAALLAEKEFPVTVMVPEVNELVTMSVLVITEVLANNLLTYKLAKRLLKEPNEITLSKFGNNEDVKALGANATPPMVKEAKDPAALLAEKEFPVTVMVPEVKEFVTTSVLVITDVLEIGRAHV
jgi:hypothetical protein